MKPIDLLHSILSLRLDSTLLYNFQWFSLFKAYSSDGSKTVSAKTKTKTVWLKTKTKIEAQDQDSDAQDQDQDQDSEPTDQDISKIFGVPCIVYINFKKLYINLH